LVVAAFKGVAGLGTKMRHINMSCWIIRKEASDLAWGQVSDPFPQA
jgi:hypothetical protein